MRLPISVVVITYNEEKNIERCLRSAPWADEWVVVDSYSQDQTVSKAHNLGARVFQEKWKGYGAQKASATEKAKHDWILNLDADEALSPELSEEIQRKFAHLDISVGYKLPRKSFFLGRWILHGGWYPDPQLRLYNRQSARWNQSQIHERVLAPREERLRHPILHWVFDDLADQVQTNNKYSSLQAEALSQKKEEFYLWKLLIKPPGKFFETFFWKMGFLDGFPGFLISVNAAHSVFLKWAKLWEKKQK